MKSKSKNNILKIDKTKKFKIVSDFEPSGDQPSAIETIVKNIKEGENEQNSRISKALYEAYWDYANKTKCSSG